MCPTWCAIPGDATFAITPAPLVDLLYSAWAVRLPGDGTLLLAGGADPDAADANCGKTALMWAAQGGHADMAAALLKAGADRAAKATGDGGGCKGKTALEIAREKGHEAVAALLR